MSAGAANFRAVLNSSSSSGLPTERCKAVQGKSATPRHFPHSRAGRRREPHGRGEHAACGGAVAARLPKALPLSTALPSLGRRRRRREERGALPRPAPPRLAGNRQRRRHSATYSRCCLPCWAAIDRVAHQGGAPGPRKAGWRLPAAAAPRMGQGGAPGERRRRVPAWRGLPCAPHPRPERAPLRCGVPARPSLGKAGAPTPPPPPLQVSLGSSSSGRNNPRAGPRHDP